MLECSLSPMEPNFETEDSIPRKPFIFLYGVRYVVLPSQNKQTTLIWKTTSFCPVFLSGDPVFGPLFRRTLFIYETQKDLNYTQTSLTHTSFRREDFPGTFLHNYCYYPLYLKDIIISTFVKKQQPNTPPSFLPQQSLFNSLCTSKMKERLLQRGKQSYPLLECLAYFTMGQTNVGHPT